MIFEQIESEGLAHYSYLIADRNRAFVIDPRRDCDVYIEKAIQNGFRIIHILETHRNEDYAIGSVELANRTGAEIWHADAKLDYKYGNAIKDGQVLKAGSLSLQAIHTPGHTEGSMSYLLHDPEGMPWMVFTGDTLFAGDVGRADLLGDDRLEEMSGKLYESVFYKLLSLGDEIIVCPAHGSGSVCGAGISARRLTTIGIERHRNLRLLCKDRDDFISKSKILEKPPYFQRMEKLNIEGAPILNSIPVPSPLSPGEFADASKDAVIVDTRIELGFGASHIPGAMSIWINGLPGFAGWFLPYNKPILLVNDTEDPIPAVRKLIRIGYDNFAGYLSGGMRSWHTAGMASSSVGMITVQELCYKLDDHEDTWILDMRGDEELEKDGQIPGAHHIHITQLPDRRSEIPEDKKIYIFCASGSRSMIGASYLRNHGWKDLTVVLGGLSGWKSTTCPIMNK